LSLWWKAFFHSCCSTDVESSPCEISFNHLESSDCSLDVKHLPIGALFDVKHLLICQVAANNAAQRAANIHPAHSHLLAVFGQAFAVEDVAAQECLLFVVVVIL
jgi:hypothetical protein